MAFNDQLVQRIREVLLAKGADFSEKKMFSGLCFMVDDKMCCGTHIDKKTGEDVMLCRLSESVYQEALEHPHCIPMEFTGKPMKGYIYVTRDGLEKDAELAHWIQLCLDFNPFAKKSKK